MRVNLECAYMVDAGPTLDFQDVWHASSLSDIIRGQRLALQGPLFMCQRPVAKMQEILCSLSHGISITLLNF